MKPDYNTPFQAEAWTLESAKYTALKAVAFPIFLPLWFTIATTALTTVKFIVGQRQSSLKYDHEWIIPDDPQSPNPENTAEPILDAQDSNEELNEERDAGENELSIFQQTGDQVRKKMIENLNQMVWIKVDVYIDAFNAHAAIVQRSPYKTGIHTNVLDYLANKFRVKS